MNSLLWMGLGNLALAAPLALLAWFSSRAWRRPAVTHGLWVLVLLKLVTPPLGFVPMAWLPAEETTIARLAVDAGIAKEMATSLPLPQMAWLPMEELDEARAFANADNNVVQAASVVAALPLNVLTSPQRKQVQGHRPGEEPFLTPQARQDGNAFAWSFIVPTLGGLWLVGALLWWARAGRRLIRFRSLLAEAEAAPHALRLRVERLADEMAISAPRVVMVPGSMSPLLWVWGRQANLVLPRDLFDRLEPEQQTALLVHELAHWRRGDHWVRRLELVARGIYWWCPLVWWAQSELRQAEEECCDAWVVATVPNSARAYALALVETVDFLAGSMPMLPPLASGLGPFPSLQRRLTMIFRNGTPRRLTVVGLLSLAALAALLLPWSPGPMIQATAQERDGDRPKGKKDGPPPREKEREKERDKDRKEEPKRGPDGQGGDFEKIRDDVRARHAELQQMQRELQAKSRELQEIMEKLHRLEGRPGGDGDRPQPPGNPDRPFPPKRGDFKPDGPRPEGQPRPPEGGPRPDGPRPEAGKGDVDRRLSDLERKLDRLLFELQNRGGQRDNPPPPPRREGGKEEGQRGPGPGQPQPRPGARPGGDGDGAFAPAPVPPRRVDPAGERK